MRLSVAYQQCYAAWSPDLSPASAQRHRYDLKRWGRLMGETSIGEISTQSYQKFRVLSAERGDSPETTETTLRTVRQVLNACAAAGELQAVPHPGRCRKGRRPAPRPATPAELRSLWEAATTARWPETEAWKLPSAWWRAWLAVGYWTGLRLTDLTWGLGREHIRQDAIRYAASKTGASHVFPMTEHLRRIVAQAAAEYASPLLSCARSANLLRKHLRTLCDNAGVRHLTPKHLRQASVTEWSKADARAGELIHGCGLPAVLRHYIDPLEILASAAPRVMWPFPDWESGPRQLLLF